MCGLNITLTTQIINHLLRVEFMNKVLKTLQSNVQEKTVAMVMFFLGLMTFGATTAQAANSDPMSNFKDYNDVGTTTISLGEQSGLQKSLANLFDILKVAFVLIGFGLFGAGVMKVVKASKTEGQQSQAPGWIMIIMGSLLSVAGFIFFAFGQGIKNALTGK